MSEHARYRLNVLGILDDEELGQLIGVNTDTLMTWRRDGRGPQWTKLGKRVFYRVERVREWIEKREALDGEEAPYVEGRQAS